MLIFIYYITITCDHFSSAFLRGITSNLSIFWTILNAKALLFFRYSMATVKEHLIISQAIEPNTQFINGLIISVMV